MTPEDRNLLDESLDDTTPWARRIMLEHWRGMSPAEKVALMNAQSVDVQRLSTIGLRRRFPQADEEEVQARAAALRIGRELYTSVTGREFTW